MNETENGHSPAAPLILAVDDELVNLRYLQQVLQRAGDCRVAFTQDPRDAVRLFTELRPDMVLLDLHMPGMSGFELMDALGALIPDGEFLPLVMITADLTPEVRQQALGRGARDFLSKPFDAGEAVLRVRNLLETRALHNAVRGQNRLLEQRVRERTEELERTHMEVLERLAEAAELRDDDTGQHTRRVGALAARLAAALGMSPEAAAVLRHSATLHDVGKIGIPDAILLKPGRLTPEERAVMQSHTTIGARILDEGRTPLMQSAERIARHHHERWDGGGYPGGLAGEDIPLDARIVAVADVFDALSHDRPYRPAWPPEKVYEELRAQAGAHFDPRVVDAFLALDPPPAP
ncbi:MAG TPA: HD domain-containing phosphohydrolase [Longimicrobium sp.]|nr:HD domain-containing phosphohydrolase [Longimicrobium sp.]